MLTRKKRARFDSEKHSTFTVPSALAVKSLVSVASWANVVISELPCALAN